MKTFSSVLRQACLEIPEQVAVTLQYSRQPDQPISYRRLLCGATGIARTLGEQSIQPGEVVVLILQHGETLLDAFFGTVLRGAIPAIMPFLTEKLAPDHYREALKALFGITRPTAVITYAEFVAEVQSAAVGSSVRVVLDGAQVLPTSSLDDLWHAAPELAGLRSAPEQIALLQHSSGTTGLQKGVALSHRAVFNQLESYGRALHLNGQDVVVSWLPLYHDMGLIAGFLMPILNRIPLVLMSPFDWVRAPQRLLQSISQYGGSLCWLPNFAYNFCAQKIRARDLEGVDLSSLRAVSNCSEPMHWKSHQMFYQRFQPYGLRASALATCYAMAENVFAVTQGGIEAPVTVDPVLTASLLSHQWAEPAPADAPEEAVIRMLSAGRPLDTTRVRVVDTHGQDLPERRIGEIALQSDCMLSAYYHRPDLTEEAFVEGWYLTGDLGYLADGEVYVTGRKKDLIIVGGKNIYPQDIERLAGDVTGVHPGRVVAFGVNDETAGTEAVVVVAELDAQLEAQGCTEDDLLRISDEVRRRVTRGSDVALRHVHLVGRGWLLKTSSGKIARSANRQKFLSEVNWQE